MIARHRRDFLSAALLLPALARQTSTRASHQHRAAGQSRRRRGAAVRPPARRRPRRAALHRPLSARSLSHLARCTPHLDGTVFRPHRGPVAPAAHRRLALSVGGRVAAPLGHPPRAISNPTSAASKRVLIECSGNADQTNYGLMSTADWEGVPLAAVLDRVRPAAGAYRASSSPASTTTREPRTSVPGASWIFTRDQLAAARCSRSA